MANHHDFLSCGDLFFLEIKRSELDSISNSLISDVLVSNSLQLTEVTNGSVEVGVSLSKTDGNITSATTDIDE